MTNRNRKKGKRDAGNVISLSRECADKKDQSDGKSYQHQALTLYVHYDKDDDQWWVEKVDKCECEIQSDCTEVRRAASPTGLPQGFWLA